MVESRHSDNSNNNNSHDISTNEWPNITSVAVATAAAHTTQAYNATKTHLRANMHTNTTQTTHLLRGPGPFLEVRVEVVKVPIPYLLPDATMLSDLIAESRGDRTPLLAALLHQLRTGKKCNARNMQTNKHARTQRNTTVGTRSKVTQDRSHAPQHHVREILRRNHVCVGGGGKKLDLEHFWLFMQSFA